MGCTVNRGFGSRTLLIESFFSTAYRGTVITTLVHEPIYIRFCSPADNWCKFAPREQRRRAFRFRAFNGALDTWRTFVQLNEDKRYRRWANEVAPFAVWRRPNSSRS